MAAAMTFALASAPAAARPPSVADLDATARSVGNRRDVAEHIGEAIFATQWSAEVNQLSANELGSHLIVGVRMWGVKFHQPMSREAFVDEVVALTDKIFAAAPDAEEIDFWASVPLDVTKGEIVSGDLAKPTSRTVFTLTVLRGERSQSLRERARRAGDGVYWDSQWARDAFKPAT
jgi:hypothetical protein